MNQTILAKLLSQLFREEERGDGGAPAGGPPASGSAEDVGEAPEPVLDDFLETAKKKDDEAPVVEAPKGEETPKGDAPTPPATPPATPPVVPPSQPPAAPATPPAAPAVPPAAIPPAQPATPPAVPPAPPAAAPQPPATPPAVPATPPAAPVPPAQPPAAQTPEQLEAKRQEERNAYIQQMEQAFAIPAEEHDALLTQPHTVLPKYAARVHVAAVEAAIGAVRAHFAPMVMAVLEQRNAASKTEEMFYSRWPKLKAPEAKAEVERLMTAYVQLNKPQNIEQAINDVGLLVHANLRIPLDAPPGAPSGQPAAAPPSAPPPPAQPGAAGGTVLVKQPTVWDKVDQELFTDD